MKGKVFRRCGTCLARLKPKARRCECGGGRYSWYFVVDIARGERRRQAKRGGFASREDAERALAEILGEVDADAVVEPSTITVAEFLTDQWLPAVRPPRLEATTWAEYRRKTRNQIVPRVGQLRLQKLKPVHLNGLYADLLVDGRMDGTGGLSPKSVREVHIILHKSLGDAVRWGFLRRNVAALADPPSIRMANVDRHANMQTWTAAELPTVRKHVQTDRLYSVWMLGDQRHAPQRDLRSVWCATSSSTPEQGDWPCAGAWPASATRSEPSISKERAQPTHR